MSSSIDPSQLALTMLSDEFEQYHRMVDRQARHPPLPGTPLERIEDWGKEFVDNFVSIWLRFLFDVVLILLQCRNSSWGMRMLRTSQQ
jgi:hypothetical protein